MLGLQEVVDLDALADLADQLLDGDWHVVLSEYFRDRAHDPVPQPAAA
jgi:hypothetical protein